ncbi:tetratricopeptide repeat protein [Alteribacter natronophilus]|uniref:tetratricopeptide repeat protein n=1 Tax=Alteribacter natronophilus TaxID=2583810 RepID=UPI00110D6EDB|nr:tetratricopeptide repeat protein [Alteribacter natronophilus]TMW73586.1 tetratricopeptide repeat protein [Alteribacter natronophilus]
MNETLEQAIQLIENGKHEEGLTKVQNMYEAADDETKRTIAELYFELGLVDRAAKAAEDLLFRYPDNGELFAFAAECYIDLGREDEAMEMLTEVKEDEPVFVQARLLLADLYQNQGLDEVAEQKLLDAVKKADGEPLLQYALGEFYLSRGDYNQSIPYYKKAVHERDLPDDDQINPLLRLAEAYSATGQFEEALDSYRKGLEKKIDPDGLFGYGYTAMQTGDYELAAEQLERLKVLDPSYTTLYPYLSQAYRHLSRTSQALDVINEGISRDEFNETLYLEAARIQFAKGNGEDGRAFLQKVIAINPSNMEAVKELLTYYSDSDSYDEVLELVSFLEDYQETDPVLDRYKGKALYETDRPAEAAEEYEKALPHYDLDSDVLEEAAAAYLESGRKEDAIELLEKALKLEPAKEYLTERIDSLREY